MQGRLDELKGEKVNLETDLESTGRQLERAQQLVHGLGGEKDRWRERAKQLSLQSSKILGSSVFPALSLNGVHAG